MECLTTEKGKQNQLVYWQQMGYLEGFNPNEPQPRNAVWSNPSEDLDDRARAYLDINWATAITLGAWQHYRILS